MPVQRGLRSGVVGARHVAGTRAECAAVAAASADSSSGRASARARSASVDSDVRWGTGSSGGANRFGFSGSGGIVLEGALPLGPDLLVS